MIKMDVCIKNINETDWRTFKVESARSGLKTGELFNEMIREYAMKNKIKGNAREILFGKKTLKGVMTKKDLEKIRTEFRTDFESFN